LIPEIKYPINKKGLIQHVKNFQSKFNKRFKKIPLRVDQALFLMENLPDSNKTYRNQGSLNDDLEITINNKYIVRKLEGRPDIKLVGCRLARLDGRGEEELERIMELMVKYDYRFRQKYEKQKQQYKKETGFKVMR
jgi:hypothetical protein